MQSASSPEPGELDRAARLLLDRVPQQVLEAVAAATQRPAKDPWWLTSHLGLGVVVRNHLRAGGFKWSDQMLDQCWHDVVERAAHLMSSESSP